MLRGVGIVVGCKKQGGFTLLEVLVAMIVMAIGLLGLASLQAVSLTRGNDSLYGSRRPCSLTISPTECGLTSGGCGIQTIATQVAIT